MLSRDTASSSSEQQDNHITISSDSNSLIDNNVEATHSEVRPIAITPRYRAGLLLLSLIAFAAAVGAGYGTYLSGDMAGQADKADDESHENGFCFQRSHCAASIGWQLLAMLEGLGTLSSSYVGANLLYRFFRPASSSPVEPKQQSDIQDNNNEYRPLQPSV